MNNLLKACVFASINFALAVSAFAQIDGFDSAGASYLDNILGSSGTRPAPPTREGMFLMGMKPGGVEDKRLWDKPLFSLTYNYSRKDSSLADDNQTDSHGISPDVYFRSSKKFSVSLSLSYLRSDSENNAQTRVAANSYGIALTPAQELITLITGKPSAVNELTLGTQLGYRWTESRRSAAAGVIDSTKDTFGISPTLTLRHVVATNLTIAAVCSYAFEAADTRPTPGSSFGTSGGLFSLLGRADYKLNDSWTVIGSAQWKHDTNQDPAPGQTRSLHDWAEFNATVKWTISKTMGAIRCGYGYEAFHPDYLTHKALLRYELSF